MGLKTKNELTKIDNIKDLYSQLNNKRKFMIGLAKELGRKPNTLYHHWFTGFYSIPEDHQDFTIKFLQKTIANQNKVKQD